MGRIADALKRSKTGIVRRQPASDAEEGLRFLGFDESHIVGPWQFDDETHEEKPGRSIPPAPAAPAPTLPAPVPLSPASAPLLSLHHQPAAASRLVLSLDLPDIAREQYRRMAATLQEIQVERGVKLVMVTSALTGEGKTLTAANLALTLAESFNRQVALIEADLRRPALHELFGLNGQSHTMSELLGGGPVPLVQVRPTLAVLAWADRMTDPITALSSARMREILEGARAQFDWVVIDTPPVGLVPDAHVLSSLVDGVVLVVAAGQTGFPAVQRACQVLGAHRLIGVVLNRADGRALDLSGGGYADYYNARDSRSSE